MHPNQNTSGSKKKLQLQQLSKFVWQSLFLLPTVGYFLFRHPALQTMAPAYHSYCAVATTRTLTISKLSAIFLSAITMLYIVLLLLLIDRFPFTHITKGSTNLPFTPLNNPFHLTVSQLPVCHVVNHIT